MAPRAPYLLGLSMAVAGLVACGADRAGSPTSGEAATWETRTALTSSSSFFTAHVSRLECSSGVTGDVLAPEVEYAAERVVVTFEVAENDEGDASCQSNAPVSYDVVLEEPLGDRLLVDGGCLPGAEAASTGLCGRDGTRWPPRS